MVSVEIIINILVVQRYPVDWYRSNMEMISKYTEDITVDCSLIQKGLGFDTQI